MISAWNRFGSDRVMPRSLAMVGPRARAASSGERPFLQELLRRPLPPWENAFALARRWRDEADLSAFHELTRTHYPLAAAIAARYRSYGLPLSDLFQEATVGLMEAAMRFEPDRGVHFSTYAMWWIRSTVRDYLLRNASIVRTCTTRDTKRLFFQLRPIRARLDALSQDRHPAGIRDKIATELRIDPLEGERMEARLDQGDSSLDATIGDTRTRWQDFEADKRPDPERNVIERRIREKRSAWLAEALRVLDRRERLIVDQRLLGETVRTLDALAKELGISKERVRQIELSALKKLRRALAGRVAIPRISCSRRTKAAGRLSRDTAMPRLPPPRRHTSAAPLAHSQISEGAGLMQKELALLVRATYSDFVQANRDTSAAFDRALELVELNRPELSEREARRAVAVAIAVEP
jgi:RNA polymerase sigma-32 factor